MNTLKWYREKAYNFGVDKNYDSSDREAAFKKALEWEDRFPIGIIYQADHLTMTDNVASLRDGPLNRKPAQVRDIKLLLENFR